MYITKLQCNEEKPLNDIPKGRARHFVDAALFLYGHLFVYELLLPSHAPFCKRAEDKHSSDGSLADLE